ncbi:LOW QUALITY PROTEIN: polyhomeotic-proximal chromatin protein-like [Paramacrobiotus metropolitanus]|uniref:LOW QUALITY PROTEIN: polyhomeotic-proximal chromatin protein-like n=1 Tax=Paramacrobiotus metropolitanus TaxID=2943436 RepID=UPI002445C07E|nr:LOW QUALITY PROTEIN: polyhomeotic-proximal chromatin protein-like [Paramacrobiotus metropolitanus]
MVQIGMLSEQNPSSTPLSRPVNRRDSPPPHRLYINDEHVSKYARSDSRMSIEGSNSEDEDAGSQESGSGAKTPSSDMSLRLRSSDSVSPKSEGFSSSPMSVCGDESGSSSSRGGGTRAVLDLSISTAFSRSKHSADADRTPPTSGYAHNLVPPYSPLSSSASMSTSPSGSPSATPEVKMDEISVHDIAKEEVIDRRARSSFSDYHSRPGGPLAAVATAGPAGATARYSDFDLPKNFYGYYVYQLELASRFSSSLKTVPNGNSSPLVGKVKPTMKSEAKEEDVVSYGSLLEQALRNGLKRSPSEIPSGHSEKKSKHSTPVSTPPPSQANSPPHQGGSQNVSRTNTAHISVEDVAETSLRELLHSKQMQEAKAAAALSQGLPAHGTSSHGSRSSSPSVNLKTLLETQNREGMKGQGSGSSRSMGGDVAFPKHAILQQQLHVPSGKHFAAGQPLLYPHILTRQASPPPSMGRGGQDGGSAFIAHSAASLAQPPIGIGFKHRKLLEWTAADVRDWISTLNYCAEFADIFLQQSVDGVALTLLNETHLMKNFGMKLGPAIKLRCAVWEILGLCQAAGAMQPQMQMPHFLNQKQIPVGHCIPQNHNSAMPKS